MTTIRTEKALVVQTKINQSKLKLTLKSALNIHFLGEPEYFSKHESSGMKILINDQEIKIIHE